MAQSGEEQGRSPVRGLDARLKTLQGRGESTVRPRQDGPESWEPNLAPAKARMTRSPNRAYKTLSLWGAGLSAGLKGRKSWYPAVPSPSRVTQV